MELQNEIKQKDKVVKTLQTTQNLSEPTDSASPTPKMKTKVKLGITSFASSSPNQNLKNGQMIVLMTMLAS